MQKITGSKEKAVCPNAGKRHVMNQREAQTSWKSTAKDWEKSNQSLAKDQIVKMETIFQPKPHNW